jgi:hypothetical protein
MEIDRLAIENHISSSRLADDAKSMAIGANQSMLNTQRNISVDDSVDAEQGVQRHQRLLSDYNVNNDVGGDGVAGSLFTIPNNLKLASKQNTLNPNGGGGSLRKQYQMLQLPRRPVLPDYLLDFGFVILGSVKTHVIRATNMSRLLASFDIQRQNFDKTGFIVDLERVKNLPNEEAVELSVTFDPRGANLTLGPVQHVIPINVMSIPTFQFQFKPTF